MAGVVIGLAGVVCCAVYTIVTRRWLPGADSTVAVVAWQQIHAFVFAAGLVAIAAISGATVVPAAVTIAGIASVVASGVVYYGLAYWFYLGALRHVPASIAAGSFYLIPVFGLAAAFGFGDRLSTVQWLGAMLVVTAVGAVAIRAAAAEPMVAAAGGSRG